ncbi:MAG: hypothetical protein ACRDTC_05110 [Pseudonocardiaceae bacterium]
MASDDYGQLTTILQRLGELGSLLNPLTLASTVTELIREIATPPPGDSTELENLAAAFRTAADMIEPIGDEVRTLGTQQLPDVWGGLAGGAAAQVVTATAKVIAATPVAFRDTAATLETLAETTRDRQRRHADLHQGLHDAYHDATHIVGLPIPNPFALDDLVRAVGALIAGARQVYTDAISAADTAAAAFADITGRARAGAGVAGGLGAADAVLLAGEQISISGLGDGYDGAILTPAQLTRAGQRLDAMNPTERARADELLGRAGSRTERAYLLEAIAAGHSGATLTGFADKILGKQPEWLHSHLNLIDPGGPGTHQRFGARIDQYDNYTCGTTSLIVTRAAADPLYALTFTEDLEKIADKDVRLREFERRFSAEQARVHDETNVFYPEFIGTSPMGMADWMNRHTQTTGATYGYQLIDDTNQRDVSGALRDVVTAVDQGHPVPILVGGAHPAHYVTVVGHQGDDLLIFEPGHGVTTRVSAEDFVNGNLRRATYFDHVQAMIVPRH